MAVNYKKEVDSGFDRKVIVERTITKLLKSGVPASEIAKHPYFIPYRHTELMLNLEMGDEELIEYMENYGDTFLPNSEGLERYTNFSHEVTEFYPVPKREIDKLFGEMKTYSDAREDERVKLLNETNKKLEKLSKKQANFISSHTDIQKIIELVEDLNNQKDVLSQDKLRDIMHKHGLKIKDYDKITNLYKNYSTTEKEIKNLREMKDKLEKNKYQNDVMLNLREKEEKVRVEIVKRNNKLINYYIRSRCKGFPIEQEDLHQELEIALLRAIDAYDPSSGFNFSTYFLNASEWYLNRNFKRLTGEKWKDFWNKRIVQGLIDEIEMEFGRKPTIEEIYNLGLLDISDKELKKLMNNNSEILVTYANKFNLERKTDIDLNNKLTDIYDEKDLEGLTDEEKESMINDANHELSSYEKVDNLDYSDDLDPVEQEEVIEGIIEKISPNSEFTETVEDEEFRKRMREEVEEVIETLTEREQKVLKLRFGFDGHPRTLDEVAKEFNVTRQRIGEIERKALRKLRSPSRSRHLKNYLNELPSGKYSNGFRYELENQKKLIESQKEFLTEEEINILSKLYSLHEDKTPYTIKDVSEELNIPESKINELVSNVEIADEISSNLRFMLGSEIKNNRQNLSKDEYKLLSLIYGVENGKTIPIYIVAKALGISVDDACEIYNNAMRHMEKARHYRNGYMTENERVHEFLQTENDVLTERERDVLNMRYGANPKSLKETADALAISTSRVREIEAKALAKVKEALHPRVPQEVTVFKTR